MALQKKYFAFTVTRHFGPNVPIGITLKKFTKPVAGQAPNQMCAVANLMHYVSSGRLGHNPSWGNKIYGHIGLKIIIKGGGGGVLQYTNSRHLVTFA